MTSGRARPFVRSLLTALLMPIALSSAAVPVAAAGAARPTAIVGMGDSFGAGEGGGDYDPGSDRVGDYCHRSASAPVNLARPEGVAAAVNLACSAATTDDVRLGGTRRYGEPPQAEQLKTVARRYRVRSIVLTIGANDVSTVEMVISCVLAYAGAGSCNTLWDKLLPQRLTVIRLRIIHDLQDIRTVMRAAGYQDGSYQMILESYSSPSDGASRYPYLTRAVQGCPFRDDDIAWVRHAAFPMISRYMHQAAESVPGVRFLGITAALQGRQVCSPGIEHGQEWTWGLFVDLAGLRIGPGPQLVAQSLHPNQTGYQHIAWCLLHFQAQPANSADCLHDSDGQMRLIANAHESKV